MAYDPNDPLEMIKAEAREEASEKLAAALAALRTIHHSLLQAAAYNEDLNGTAPKYEDAKAPDGDDYNEIMAWVDHAFAVAEDALRTEG
jgi:hypothetical protein